MTSIAGVGRARSGGTATAALSFLMMAACTTASPGVDDADGDELDAVSAADSPAGLDPELDVAPTDTPEVAAQVDAELSVDAELAEPSPEVTAPSSPCVLPSGNGCSATGNAGPIVDVAEEAAFEGAFLCRPVIDETPCPDAVCHLGTCLSGSDAPPDGAATWLASAITITGTPSGRDLDGDGTVDNAFADALTAASFSLGLDDVDKGFVDVIAKGRYLLSLQIDVGPSPDLWFARTDAAAGSPPPPVPAPVETVVHGRSETYVPGTQVPMSRVLATGTLEAGLEASGTQMSFPIVAGIVTINLTPRDVVLALKPDGDTLEFELSGYILLTEFADSYNEYFARTCACAGLHGPVVGVSQAQPEQFAPWTEFDDLGACDGGETGCLDFMLFSASGLIEDILLPDLDVDDDGTLDALSFGLRGRFVPIAGVIPP